MIDLEQKPAACRLLPDVSPRLSRRQRLFGMIVALALTIGYFYFLICFWAPADGRDDQNGYLVGGRQYARTLSTGYKPASDFGFVGDMWVRAPDGTNYPKYPIGLPMLYAASLKLFGDAPDANGVRWAYLVSPICSALSMLGVYFLGRRVAGVLASICAMLLYAFGPGAILFANNPNSHAASVAFVVWGFYFLFRHWQTGSITRGLLGGFLLGYATTIRYTEGTHALVIALVAITMIRPNFKSIFITILPTLGWLIPVGYLVAFNHHAMGTITGYDTTHESEFGQAFTWDQFYEHWEIALREIHNVGTFFFLPIGVMGMLALMRRSVRLTLALLLWFVPGLVLYMSYYWVFTNGGWYLRFFLTLFPAVAMGAAYVMRQTHQRGWGSAVAIGAVTAISCSLNLYHGMMGLDGNPYSDQGMKEQFHRAANLAGLGEVAARAMPEGSIVFAMPDEAYYLQFVGQYDMYRADCFRTGFRDEMYDRLHNSDIADQFQKERSQFLVDLYQSKSDADLVKIQNRIMTDALTAKKRVFAVLTRELARDFRRKFCRDSAKFTAKEIATYAEMPRLPEVDPSDEERVRRFHRRWGDSGPPPVLRFVVLEVTGPVAGTAAAGQ